MFHTIILKKTNRNNEKISISIRVHGINVFMFLISQTQRVDECYFIH